MQSKSTTVTAYMQEVPEERRKIIEALRKVIKQNLPKGFEEQMNYGMIGYVVPHTLYPGGYHCKPSDPLPFMNIASQKNFIVIYHMGMYADPSLLKWFTEAYAQRVKGKLDMGKSCIRFKKPDQIPVDLIGELASKMSPQQWIQLYEQAFRK
jgi:hypothetical protein